MDAQLRGMLNDSERELLRSSEPRELKKLDEDDLAALHDRIRRARTKYSKLYRRRASAQVAQDRSRKSAHAAHAKAARKAEGFEDALARVSRRLADVAEASAADLKQQRLQAARRPPTLTAGTSTPRSSGARPSKSSTRTPTSEKKRASTKASNKRTQAARDRRS